MTTVLPEEMTGPVAVGVPIADPGVDAALEELYDEHYVRLVRLAVLLLGDAGRAEEVVQDSFVAVYQRWDRLGGADVPAYLRQTVVNRSRSALRHRAVVERHVRREGGLAVLHEGGADAASMTAARRDAVLEALRQLPTRQREVIALRYYLDLSEAEIAEALGISAGAVKSHASRGAAALRAHLGNDLEDLR